MKVRKSKQKERSSIPKIGLTHSITMFTHNFTSTMAKGKDRHFSKDDKHKSYMKGHTVTCHWPSKIKSEMR